MKKYDSNYYWEVFLHLFECLTRETLAQAWTGNSSGRNNSAGHAVLQRQARLHFIPIPIPILDALLDYDKDSKYSASL